MSYPVSMSMEELEATVSPEPATPATPAVPVEPVAEPQPASGQNVDSLREALRISEEARMQLAQRFSAPQQDFQPQQPQVQQPKVYSRQELFDMMQSDDPAVRWQAMEINTNQTIAQAAQHFENRLAPITNGTVSSARAQAEAAYNREFSLFKKEIDELVHNLPDKSSLTTKAGWDNLIAFVRGQPGNIDKYVEDITTQRANAAKEAARTAAAQNTPWSPAPTRGSVGGSDGSAPVVDDVTRQIAFGLGYASVDAYLKDVHNYEKRSFNG